MLSILLSSEAFAQSSHKYPIQKQFESYFKSRTQELQKRLYNMAIKRELMPYKTDSLASIYSKEEFALRGATTLVDGSTQSFSPNDLKGIWFLKAYNKRFNTDVQNTEMKALCLVFQPKFGGALANPQPMVWFSREELKTKLDSNDFRYLLLLYNFAAEGPRNWIYQQDFENAYFLNLFYSKSIVKTDTFLYKEIGMMLSSNYCFISDLSQDFSIGQPDRYFVFDLNNKRRLPMEDIGKTYYTPVTVFLNTDEKDPRIGKDTVYNDPVRISSLSSVFFDENTGLVVHFEYTFVYGQNRLGYFQIPRSVFTHFEAAEISLWYVEDYFRWQLKKK